MDWGALGFGLTLLVVVAGLVRWLFAVWFDQQRKLDDMKASYAAAAFTDLDSVVKVHSGKLQDLILRLSKLEQDITLAVLKIDDLKQSHREGLIMIKERESKTDKRFEDLISENRKISEQLIMVRGKRADTK